MPAEYPVPAYISFAIPFFFLLIFIELAVSNRVKKEGLSVE